MDGIQKLLITSHMKSLIFHVRTFLCAYKSIVRTNVMTNLCVQIVCAYILFVCTFLCVQTTFFVRTSNISTKSRLSRG